VTSWSGPSDAIGDHETVDVPGEALARWMIEAYETLVKARDLLAQLAPAAPLLDEIEALIERAEEPYPTDLGENTVAGHSPETFSVQPDGLDQPSQDALPREGEGAPVASSPAPLVPEHQQDELYDQDTVVAPAGGLAEFTPPEQTAGLDGPVDVVAALALMLVLCRLLLENNGLSASGGFVNEALSIVEELWGKVDAETRASAEDHASDWEAKAGW
jgi:hypothetical protein